MNEKAIIIQKQFKEWQIRISQLEPLKTDTHIITYNSINVFTEKNKVENDTNNSKRENIIAAIINNLIPPEYYKFSVKWKRLEDTIFEWIDNLCIQEEIFIINNISCIQKAGRSNNYDFKIIINKKYEYKVEFKFNATFINETPQFVSPHKPSQYLNMDFEQYFYDNYLEKIANFGSLEMPPKEEYLKKIHGDKVQCMIPYKYKYDNDNEFKKICKKIDKEGIKNFIYLSEINKEKLSNYLCKTQTSKRYMLYKDTKMYYEENNKDLYIIKQLISKENTNYIYETESGMKLEIKLRFKNGCGLQYPAFQIKRKIPNLTTLKQICKSNNIKIEKIEKLKKADICNILDKHGIIY